MSITLEFSRPVRLDALGGQPRSLTVTAKEGERAALAERFSLIAIDRLVATAECTRDGDAIDVTGTLSADVVQSCVASAEPVPAHIEEAFTLRFVPAPSLEYSADEVELSEVECDIIGYEGGAIDLGEAVAETLALALDPFPRSSDADAALRSAGVLTEEDAGPFAALKGLKDRLGKT